MQALFEHFWWRVNCFCACMCAGVCEQYLTRSHTLLSLPQSSLDISKRVPHISDQHLTDTAPGFLPLVKSQSEKVFLPDFSDFWKSVIGRRNPSLPVMFWLSRGGGRGEGGGRLFTLTSPPLLSPVLGTDYWVLLVSFRPNASFGQIFSVELLQVGPFYCILYHQVKLTEASVGAQ